MLRFIDFLPTSISRSHYFGIGMIELPDIPIPLTISRKGFVNNMPYWISGITHQGNFGDLGGVGYGQQLSRVEMSRFGVV